MTGFPTKWERLVPKRVENVLDALRILTRTGAKDYEPISAEHASEMLTIIRDAVGELEAAYAPYVGNIPEVEAPRPAAAPAAGSASPELVMPKNPLLIARFIHEIPKELLPSWSVHLCTRITDEFHEVFKS